MIKYLLPLFLLLTGCSHYTWNDPSPIEHHPSQLVQSTGYAGPNSWSCTLTDVNPAVVWIECKFLNHFPSIAGKSKSNNCIRVYFRDGQSKKWIVESRKICSGYLGVDEMSIRYVAFIGQNRKALDGCGLSLEKCDMMSQLDLEIPGEKP